MGGGVNLIPPVGGIHFKTSKAMSGVNFFDHTANSGFNFSALQVYINDNFTNISANALTANAGDDIRIVSRSDLYPFFYPSDKDYIASIEEPLPFMGETDFTRYFYNCTSLVSISQGLFDNNPNVTNFSYCFRFCSALTSIPSGLFDNNPQVTNFSYCFAENTSLTSIPKGLFDNNPQVTNFAYCFASCSSLLSIPEGLFDNNTFANDFSYCFAICTSLTSIPKSLFDKNTKASNFSSCFYNCRNLRVNVQVGSTTTEYVRVGGFARGAAARGTVYCRASSAAYNAFLNNRTANVNVLTY